MAPQEVAFCRELTGPERALWELQRRAPNCGAWNQALAVYAIGGQLTVPALTAALNLIVRRHPALRTRYPALDGEPTAVTAPPEQAALEVAVRGPGHGLWPDELRAAAGRPFDLARDPPVRVTVLRFRGVDTLVLALHGLVGDPWTARLVYQELAAGYRAFATGAPVPPELAGNADVAAQPPHCPPVAGYWQDRLAGFDPASTVLAVGRGDPPEPLFAGALLAQPLGPPAHGAVPAVARQLGVTEDTVLLATYFALLAYHGGGPDLVVGLQDEPAGGPARIGYRTGTLPIRVHVDLSGSFAGLAAAVRDSVRAAVEHQPAPPDAGPPLIRHTFRSIRQPSHGWLGELPTRSAPVDTGHSWYDTAVEVTVEPARTEVRVAYRSELFGEDDVRALVQRYDTVLCQAAAEPGRRLAELNWWTSADRALIAGAHRPGTGAVVQDEHGRPLPPGVRGQLRQDGASAGARMCYDGRIELLATSRPRIVVLAGRTYPGWSGMDLRWRALCAALGRHADCTYREIRCDRREHCRSACQLTGEPAPADSVAWWTDGSVWYPDRRFCEEYAARLARELAADGVSMVVCSGLETSRYVPALAARPGLTVVFDMHNVERALAEELHRAAPPGSYYATAFPEETLPLVEAVERAAVAAADAVWVCSPSDRALVATLYGDSAADRTTVVPNVVSVPGPARPASGCARVVYTGRMDYYPNMDAGWRLGYEIAPLLRSRGHDVPVVIAGGYAQEMLSGPSLPPGVHLVSSPASTVELIIGGIMAVPLAVGGGTRFKILEAFAYGTPVVSTAKGAEGLDLVAGVHYLNAESPAEFAGALDTLLRDPELRNRLADAAWQVVRERYSVDALAQQLGPVVGAAPPGQPARSPS